MLKKYQKNAITSNIKYKIIGRSPVDFNLFKHEFSCKEQKQTITVAKNFLLDKKVGLLPLDVIKIAKICGWGICPYSKAIDVIKAIDEDLLYTDWGFTACINDNFYIFYNDETKAEVQRFTLAHEFGHIILNHLKKPEIYTQEKAANLFAEEILMPFPILQACNIQTAKGIEILCGVSFSAANYRFGKYMKWINNPKNSQKIDVKLRNQFSSFIQNKNRYQSI